MHYPSRFIPIKWDVHSGIIDHFPVLLSINTLQNNATLTLSNSNYIPQHKIIYGYLKQLLLHESRNEILSEKDFWRRVGIFIHRITTYKTKSANSKSMLTQEWNEKTLCVIFSINYKNHPEDFLSLILITVII